MVKLIGWYDDESRRFNGCKILLVGKMILLCCSEA